ncbi:hypothetical protein JCM15548_13799 [Geofilum rubicundum JCM 15548]|uniref:Abi-like protein n=2 Tax=Geofilum TaxID=1236988 RepID=A0A0E9M1T2_9BACT|nr:hypothetical protein JCM15548_13799 [Geofilum rubicundum JCM 15548]
MNYNTIVETIISKERLQPYLNLHSDNYKKAITHYKANILISESFYPIISMLEVGLRNSIDRQLSRKFNSEKWYEDIEFIKIASRHQINKISEARANIQSAKKEVTTGRIISELTFGYWTSLFDTKFETILWKNLRFSFPNCPKNQRKRKTISSKLNGIRKFRNRIFHHEPISWNLIALNSYKEDIIEAINWLDKDLLKWLDELNHVDMIIEKYRGTIS